MTKERPALSSEAEAIRARLLEQPETEIDATIRWQVAEARSDPQLAADLHSALDALDADTDTPKALRKAARKARFLLEQAGLASRSVAPPTVEAVVETQPAWRAWLTSTDGSGTTGLLLARSDKPLTYRVLEVYVQEGRGITLANENTFSTHDLDGFVKQLEADIAPLVLAEVPPDYVKHRIAVAARETREAGLRTPNVLAYWSSALEGAEGPMDHPAEHLIRLAENHRPAEETMMLTPTVGWQYDRPRLHRAIEILSEVLNSKLAVEEHVREQRLEEAERRAARELFDEDTARRHRQRLLDLALLTHLKDVGSAAECFMAAAQQIASEGSSSAYALAFLRRSLAYQAAAERTRQQEGRR